MSRQAEERKAEDALISLASQVLPNKFDGYVREVGLQRSNRGARHLREGGARECARELEVLGRVVLLSVRRGHGERELRDGAGGDLEHGGRRQRIREVVK